MSDYIVWLDSAKAHVFELSLSGIKTFEVKKEDTQHQKNDSLFKDLAQKLIACEKLLLMGPGLAKNHFKSYLNEHYTHSLATHIVGTETCDHPTDNQILAIARNFFMHYDLFNVPIQPGRSRG